MNLADLANPEPHFMAAVDLLKGGGLTVGEGDGAGLPQPYVVVYLLPSDGPRGPVGEHQADETMSLQTTCVNDSARGVEWLKHQVRQLMYGLTVPGRRVQVTRDMEFQTAFDRDVDPPLWRGGDRWAVWSTPA
jgi:hypothetical protein